MSQPRRPKRLSYRRFDAAVLALALSLAACSHPSVVRVPATQDEASRAVLDADRGRLLYETHCIACHDQQVHWREHSIVVSWSDLVVQVDRWQNNAGQDWSPSDIGDVAAYLNSLYYRMPCSAVGCRGVATASEASVRTTLMRDDVAPLLWPDAQIRFPFDRDVR